MMKISETITMQDSESLVVIFWISRCQAPSERTTPPVHSHNLPQKSTPRRHHDQFESLVVCDQDPKYQEEDVQV